MYTKYRLLLCGKDLPEQNFRILNKKKADVLSVKTKYAKLCFDFMTYQAIALDNGVPSLTKVFESEALANIVYIY